LIDLQDVESTRIYAGVFVAEVLFWGLIGVAVSSGWIPFVLVPGFLVFNAVVLLAVYYVSTDTGVGFSRFQVPGGDRENRLSEHEAFELTRFLLLYRRDMRIDEVVDRGIEPAVSPSDSSEDARRLFKLVFERVNVNEKVGVYVDLEQSIEVDLDSYDSLSNAADKVENIRVIRGSKTTEFWQRLNEAQVSMGRNSDSVIRIENDEGKTAEYPVGALPKTAKEEFVEVE
jgi:hypothetical protein